MDTYEKVLKALIDQNDDIVVMTAENRAAIRGLPPLIGDKFIDVGISEMTMVGMASGLALRGRIPITHALANFLVFRAYEFVRGDVGIGKLPVKLVACVPGFLSTANGPTHQSLEDIALMREIPGMQAWCPSDKDELLAGMKVIFTDKNAPCYVRYNDSKPVVEHKQPFEIGKAEVLQDGTDVTLMTYGFLLEQVWNAKARLEAAGKSVRVVNMRMVEPLDEAAVLASVEKTRAIVTIEDHFVRGGLFTAVSELLVREQKMTKVIPLAMEAKFFKPVLMPDLLKEEGFTGEALAGRILERM